MSRWTAVAIAAACLACSPARRDAEQTTRGYADGVVQAYRRNDPKLAEPYASVREMRRVTALVDLKRSSGLALDSALERFEVAAVQEFPDHLVARTRERWRYHDRPLDAVRPAGPEFLADMDMEYELVREDGRWRVDAVRTVGNQYRDPTTGAPIDRPRFEPEPGEHGAKGH